MQPTPSPQAASEPDPARPETLLLEHLDLLRKTAARLCRRCRLPEADAEEFESWAIVRLLANDGAILRACRSASSAKKYLRTVVRNLFNDYRNHLWGKWRPSRRARRLGTVAVELERLWRRDRHHLREAIEILRARRGCTLSVRSLEDLATQLPQQFSRRFDQGVELDELPADGETDQRLVDRDRRGLKRRIHLVLETALAAVSDDDRRILQLHLEEGRTLASIARLLRLNQRALYNRRDRCLQKMREVFQLHGLGWNDVARVQGWDDDEALVPPTA